LAVEEVKAERRKPKDLKKGKLLIERQIESPPYRGGFRRG
jgi:hypothetical protein